MTLLDWLIFLGPPLTACLILVGIHCWLGLHVVSRGIYFIDLSLAQLAALGSVIAVCRGYENAGMAAQGMSFAATFVGAAVFTFCRFREEHISSEALIGIVYAVCAALAILLLDRSPHGAEALKHMLVGDVLFVSWHEVLKMAVIYSAVGLLHFVCRKPLLLISTDLPAARQKGINVQLWDFVFYVSFGAVVTCSVQVAGVLLVFSYLIIPAVAAMFWTSSIGRRLAIGWIIGFAGSLGGLTASARWDFPTGASVVTTLGLLLALATLLHRIFRWCS